MALEQRPAEALLQLSNTFRQRRLRPAQRGGGAREVAMVKVGVVGRLHTGTTLLDNEPFLPTRLRATLVPGDVAAGRPGAGAYISSDVASDLYVQEAYATFRMSRLSLRVGRQRVQSGTGYAYNPTDLFNRRVPLDPTYEADGIDAVAVRYAFSPTTDVQLLTTPRGDPGYRARLQGRLGGADLALQFTSVVRTRVDWIDVNTPAAVSALSAGAVTVDDFARAFRWNQVAAEFSRTVRGVRLYGELGVVFIERPADAGSLGADSATHERLLVGADHTFASKVRVIAEYMRIGEARAGGDLLTLNDEVASFKGEILSSDRDNAFVEISSPLARRVSGALKVLGVISHPAVGINPWLYVDPRPNLRLAVSLYGYAGRAESSYSNVGLGAFAEVRYTF